MAQKRTPSVMKYLKKATSLIQIRLMNAGDADVLEYLHSLPNKSVFARQAVRVRTYRNADRMFVLKKDERTVAVDKDLLAVYRTAWKEAKVGERWSVSTMGLTIACEGDSLEQAANNALDLQSEIVFGGSEMARRKADSMPYLYVYFIDGGMFTALDAVINKLAGAGMDTDNESGISLKKLVPGSTAVNWKKTREEMDAQLIADERGKLRERAKQGDPMAQGEYSAYGKVLGLLGRFDLVEEGEEEKAVKEFLAGLGN